MVQLLTESIAIAIEAAFGDNFTIYQESIEQDLKEPCFFIQCLEASDNLFRGRRYFLTHQLCIQYFPASDNAPKAECEAVAEQLYILLEWLTLHHDGSRVMGRKMRHKTVDGVLSFFVNYDLYVMRTPYIDPMQKMGISMVQKKEEKSMAKTKTTTPEAVEPTPAAPEATFTKEQLAASKRFQHRRDVIRAILEDDKKYTIEQAQAEIDAFFGKKVQ